MPVKACSASGPTCRTIRVHLSSKGPIRDKSMFLKESLNQKGGMIKQTKFIRELVAILELNSLKLPQALLQ